MKTRIIVAAIAIPILLLVIFFAPLWAFAILVGIISAGAAWELLRCAASELHVRFRIYAMVFGMAIAVGSAFFEAHLIMLGGLFGIILICFVEMMFSFKKEPMKLEALMLVVFAGGIMPILLSSLVRVGAREHSSLYLLLPFIAAFTCDSGAYFAGKFLGKKKIFPHLSPNKTLEGCAGGLLCDVIFMLIYGFILARVGYTVDYFAFALYGVLGSIACQLGDLAFSAIKRVYGIKDYGTLIPGHGGMLDRFDSMHFTAPMIEIMVLLLPAIVA